MWTHFFLRRASRRIVTEHFSILLSYARVCVVGLKRLKLVIFFESKSSECGLDFKLADHLGWDCLGDEDQYSFVGGRWLISTFGIATIDGRIENGWISW
jgi:hypothetical protein